MNNDRRLLKVVLSTLILVALTIDIANGAGRHNSFGDWVLVIVLVLFLLLGILKWY